MDKNISTRDFLRFLAAGGAVMAAFVAPNVMKSFKFLLKDDNFVSWKKFNDSRVTALRGRIAALENQRKALIGQRAARILELEREIPVLERNSQNVHNDPYASSKAKSDQLRRLAKAKTELAELKKQKD